MQQPTIGARAVTASLARELAGWRDAPLPEPVTSHAKIHFLNALALAVSASDTAGVRSAVKLAQLVGGSGGCPVPGRKERLDCLGTAMAIGIACHVDDFDDTHLATVIHPSSPTLATVLPLGLEADAAGGAVLRAFVWGIEVQLRVGQAMSPSHYDAGWHITGTAGVIGTAAAAGLLLGLDEPAMTSALAIAASSTVGQREGFGTMTKAFHVGKAASNGIIAARLAQRGFTGPHDALEAPRGYWHVLAAHSDPSVALDGLGASWLLLDDAVKPYPCGIVAHPLIDAGRELRAGGAEPGRLRRLTVDCNPLVPDLMGVLDPADGLQARFSAVHGLAVGVLDEMVGLSSFADDRVRAADATALRSITELVPDPSCARDAVSVTAVLDDGSRRTVRIDHARGSVARPLTEAEVTEKVNGLLRPVLGERSGEVIRAVTDLDAASDLSQIFSAVTPEGSAVTSKGLQA